MRAKVRSASVRLGAATGLDPSGAMLPVERLGQPSARLLCFGERPNTAFAQFRQQCEKYARGDECIAGRGVTVLRHNAEPGRQLIQRETRKVRLDQFSE